MLRTLLIGDPSTSWRDWLRENREDRDLICLDPADPIQTPPGRLTLHQGEKVTSWRFYGSLDPLRAPHILLAALAQLLSRADDVVVQLPAFRPSPLMRQVTLTAAELVQPSEILVSSRSAVAAIGFPVGPTEVDLEAAFPESVQEAQRKAQWLKLIEGCEQHELLLREVTFEGSRLGSGDRVSTDALDLLHLEACGSTLLIVANGQPDDRELARLLDHAHCSRAHVVSPESYDGLLCSFARQGGEDFGMGFIDRIDFPAGVIHVKCTAVPPVRVPILRLGGLSIDANGNEVGEIRPWQV